MSLTLVLGCMYSGKSTELMRQIKREKIISDKYLIISSKLDTRYGINKIISHDHESFPCISVSNLSEISDSEIKNNDKIFIEEGHFFDDLVEYVSKWVDEYKKEVIVFGLSGDFERKPFKNISELISMADSVKMLKSLCSICNDGTEAIFSKRLSVSKEKIEVGSHDVYIPVCRECYLKPK
jgi:thymidine kinase